MGFNIKNQLPQSVSVKDDTALRIVCFLTIGFQFSLAIMTCDLQNSFNLIMAILFILINVWGLYALRVKNSAQVKLFGVLSFFFGIIYFMFRFVSVSWLDTNNNSSLDNARVGMKESDTKFDFSAASDLPFAKAVTLSVFQLSFCATTLFLAYRLGNKSDWSH
jgi:hypothetical protein